jgi:vanadium chloroperoxidase
MSLPVLPDVIEDGGPRDYQKNCVLFWNNVALDLNRLTHSLSGPQGGPPLSARALGILHIAIHDAYFSLYPATAHPGNQLGNIDPYLSATILGKADPKPLGGSPTIDQRRAAAKDAVAGAAITVLNKLYRNPEKRDLSVSTKTTLALGDFIDTAFQHYSEAHHLNLRSGGYEYGIRIAVEVLTALEIKATEPGTDAGTYMPNSNEPYFFDDDPTHPVRLRPIDPNDPEDGLRATRPYHAPRYGSTATILAVTSEIKVADPPVDPRETLVGPPSTANLHKYLESLEDVHRMGGAKQLATTKRRPAQTAAGLFWAYDGANLIGTPSRLYNQIIRQVAFDKQALGGVDSDLNNAEFARLLALANVAMTDAGIFCWREKYKYELWRPLSGVRQDPAGPVPDGFSRPTWEVLGAPATNSNEGGFKPPFPAYPSGHATFAAAGFQMVRLFYDRRGDHVFEHAGASASDKGPEKPIKPHDSKHGNDCIEFKFISDELNGISRELYQTYDPSRPLTGQLGDVRTRLPYHFESMKHAIFSCAMSRIWLGVHWHFDALAGEDICVQYTGGPGRDNNQPRPFHYNQLYQVEDDGSTKYQTISNINFFGTLGPRAGDPNQWNYGGVPLGILIADNIFNSGMKYSGSLVTLSDPTAHKP